LFLSKSENDLSKILEEVLDQNRQKGTLFIQEIQEIQNMKEAGCGMPVAVIQYSAEL
jgi:hypothetical protein